MLKDWVARADHHIKAGARDYGAYSRAMLEDFGETVRPYLRSIYESLKSWPGYDTTGMSSPDEIDRFVRTGLEKRRRELIALARLYRVSAYCRNDVKAGNVLTRALIAYGTFEGHSPMSSEELLEHAASQESQDIRNLMESIADDLERIETGELPREAGKPAAPEHPSAYCAGARQAHIFTESSHLSASLEWDQVRQFFRNHGCVMAKRPEMQWYREAWGALEMAGLTCTAEHGTRSLNQSELKLRAICLLAMYLGFYQVTGEYSELGDFSDHMFPWYLETLDMTMEDVWNLASHTGWLETDFPSYQEDEEADDEWLTEIAQEMVREHNRAIFEALRDHYGGTHDLFMSLRNSRFSRGAEEDPEDALDNLWSDIQTGDIWNDDEDMPWDPEDAYSPFDSWEGMEIREYVEHGMVGWWWT